MRSGIVNEGFEKLQVKLLHNLCPIDLSTGVCVGLWKDLST
jgi:hypothetical protein